MVRNTLLCTIIMVFPSGLTHAQQIDIDRINRMPNLPAPYEMRDWKEVARAYDAFVFDFGRTGQYLPLISWNPNTVNYPERPTFRLHTVVGTTHPNSSEAINVLPALVSASLVGIDKTDQDGHNWVLMSQEYFNRRPEENVYLNHPVTSSGNDWWYDTMPNVFFYQLYDLYGAVGDAGFQFRSVADRWLEAVERMGGSAAPWQTPNMNNRGWRLASMTPNRDGVRQPEAAGAIAWLLYHAYLESGEERYRMGAEWAMEFLNEWTSNPSYELQLSYGAYIAAKMNAQLGTGYDLEKLLNWCFDVGPLRRWGAIVGNWGGYDTSGLIGEVSGNDYAFSMNTFQQAGALVPLVRYDDRFARAIGKWMLNAANAARLFYSNYLPPDHQDGFAWSSAHDSESVIAYEALRRTHNSRSPFITGDAVSGGWGATNLSLYSSSHAGIFGAIIDTTDVPMILKLDVLKADYFRSSAYPTYLLFNPYDESRAVSFEAGDAPADLYDAVSKQFIAHGVLGSTPVTIPADGAVLIVVLPAGGAVEYVGDHILVNGVVADYRTGSVVENYPPRIKGVGVDPETIFTGITATLYCTAEDRDGDPLEYAWTANGGALDGDGPVVQWQVPAVEGTYSVDCTVSDGRGGTAHQNLIVQVTDRPPSVPEITSITASSQKIDLGARTTLTCTASDLPELELTYAWEAGHGHLEAAEQQAVWTAPAVPGDYSVVCIVRNDDGGEARDSVTVLVRDFAVRQPGELIAHYPLDGDASDHSPFGHHGVVNGAVPAADRFGNPSAAYLFNGTTANIRVPNHQRLNFRDAITLSFWMRVDDFFAREQYPISHGNWENRWKVSISDRKIRWTIKTERGVIDLDSPEAIRLLRFYHVVAIYDGADVELWMDGRLASFAPYSGRLGTTMIDLMIGQVLPDNTSFNFKGVIDDVRLFDYALLPDEIGGLYSVDGVMDDQGADGASRFTIAVFPNPFTESTSIHLTHRNGTEASIDVFDVLGRRVRRIPVPASHGPVQLEWDGRDDRGVPLAAGVYFIRLTAGDDVRTTAVVKR